MPHPRLVLTTVVATLLLTVAACSGSDGGSDAIGSSTTTPRPTTTNGAGGEANTTTTAPAAEAEPLQILVSNDDGYAADGIDVLVKALGTIDDVEITVVAPLAQQSGTGGKSTEGPLAVTDVELPAGHRAMAVDGFPADTIRVAIDEQGIEPDLVITGINEGQNLGPFVDISGTVGAARAGVARGVPALATSQGSGTTFDYEAAVPLVLDWIAEHRSALLTGDEPVAVTNLNVPSCDTGEVRGLAEVEADPRADPADALAPQDCTSTVTLDPAAGDVAAFRIGYATIGTVPARPAG